jgi:3-oxoacyl-[acyl-carrier protein] reductase
MERKIALITGSTQGIGKAIALELYRNGFKIVINGARTNQLSFDYINELNEIREDKEVENYLFVQADISLKVEREKLINEMRNKFSKIDVLINNAGIAPEKRVDLLETTEESFEKLMKVNLQGSFFLTQAIAKWMIEIKRINSKTYEPYVINISSISSFTASINRAEYCISKAGMSMMTKLFAVRLSEFKIPVFEIQPGIIYTPMTRAVKEKYDTLIDQGLIPIKRCGYPKDVAKVVLLIVNGGIPYSTGDVIKIDGGFHLQRL